MNSLQFWKSWPPAHQRMFWMLAGLVVIALSFLWTSDFFFPAPTLTARTIHYLDSVEFTWHSFRLGSVELHIPADALLIFERTLGGPMKPNEVAAYIFLGALMTSIVILLSVVSGLGRFWFYIALALLILLVLSFRFDSLLIFGLSNKLPAAGIFFLFGLPAYYFQFVNKGTLFSRRLLVFTTIGLVTGLGIFLSARVPHPFQHIASGGIISGTILMVVFMFMVAPEILSTLVTVISMGTRQTKSLRHFLVISAIYLANLALIYMNKKHLVDWNFLPINLFAIATISGVLGLWGFRQRESLYSEIVEANPLGVFLYLALALIGFGTIGYFLATANDPVIQFAQDLILYSHLGYGLIFVIYVISNFSAMLANNLQVYRVLYKPMAMPYFTFRLAGLIATFTFFAYSNWRVSIDQVYAGYFNAYGDLYLRQDTLLADASYQRSTLYALRNYHAHYALAQIKASRGEGEEEKNEYQKLVDARPIDLAYLNLNRTYERNNDLEKSREVLKAGLRDFPKNSRLENELGMVFSKSNERDSAWWYVNQAHESSGMKSESETNLLGLAAKFKLSFSADSLLTAWGPENPGLKSNALALASVEGKTLATSVDPGTDTLLSIYSIVGLHNYLLNNREQMDTALIAKTIQWGRQNPDPYYTDFLLSSAAYASYANGQTIQAIHLLRELAFGGQNEKYYDVLGLWSLEQNAPDRAVGYFDEALQHDFKPSYFKRALALTELSDLHAALIAWDSLKDSGDATIRQTAANMMLVLNAAPEEVTHLGEEEKYLYLRYRIALQDEGQFERIVSSIKNPLWRTRAFVDRSKELDEADEIDRAAQTLALTESATMDKELYEEIAHLNLRFLARQKNWPLLEAHLKTGISFHGKFRLEKTYIDALFNARADQKQEARKKFLWLLHADPFFEDAIVAALDFLNDDPSNNLKYYGALVEALELNPNSIKLLKIHAVMSVQLDFEENAKSSLDLLKKLMDPVSFVAFLKENPKSFVVTMH